MTNFSVFAFQICRNINRIKVFMETGKTVVLLNLENLYESLYDALNQVKKTIIDFVLNYFRRIQLDAANIHMCIL